MNSSIDIPFNGERFSYDLEQVVVHSGPAAVVGHYYCFSGQEISLEKEKEKEKEMQWFLFNDSHVSTVSFDNVRNPSQEFKSDVPYFLIFRKRKGIVVVFFFFNSLIFFYFHSRIPSTTNCPSSSCEFCFPI